MINERTRHISRPILAVPWYCRTAQSDFQARENDDKRGGGIRNCSRRDVADLLPADDAIAEPPRQSWIFWQQLRSGRRRLWLRRRRLEPFSLVRWRPFRFGRFGQSDRLRRRRRRWRRRLTLAAIGKAAAV